MPDQDYIDQEVERHHQRVNRLQFIPRQERQANVADLTARLKDVDHFVIDCEAVMCGDFGCGVQYLFWKGVENSPRVNHAAILGSLVAVYYNVSAASHRQAFNKLDHDLRKQLNARIRQAIDERKKLRGQS
jgi:predicted outer membrane protein